MAATASCCVTSAEMAATAAAEFDSDNDFFASSGRCGLRAMMDTFAPRASLRGRRLINPARSARDNDVRPIQLQRRRCKQCASNPSPAATNNTNRQIRPSILPSRRTLLAPGGPGSAPPPLPPHDRPSSSYPPGRHPLTPPDGQRRPPGGPGTYPRGGRRLLSVFSSIGGVGERPRCKGKKIARAPHRPGSLLYVGLLLLLDRTELPPLTRSELLSLTRPGSLLLPGRRASWSFGVWGPTTKVVDGTHGISAARSAARCEMPMAIIAPNPALGPRRGGNS